jgi:hypothetical protein
MRLSVRNALSGTVKAVKKVAVAALDDLGVDRPLDAGFDPFAPRLNRQSRVHAGSPGPVRSG